MRAAIASLKTTDDNASQRKARPAGSTWVRFGDQAFVFSPDDRWEAVEADARRAGTPFEPLPDPVCEENLYLVVQKGRLFQQEHPEVPVRLDKGRYLVVELDPAAADRAAAAEGVCYTVEPLPREGVVFDQRPAAPAARRAPVDWITAVADRVDRAPIQESLEHLVSYHTRYSTHAEYGEAAAWATGKLEALGYETSQQPIQVGGGLSWNVVADKPGAGNGPKDLLLVVAHLDSVNMTGTGDPAPGADDNGSGSAGALEMARVLATHEGVNDLRFVLFGGEEQGLFGSRQYLASLKGDERTRIRAVVNMDMIGTVNTNDLSVLVEGGEVSRTMIDELVAAAGDYTGLAVQTSLRPYNSDHVPFIEAGIPAVLTIEGADSANHSVHSANDILDHISYDLMAEILRMNVAFLAAELGRPG